LFGLFSGGLKILGFVMMGSGLNMVFLMLLCQKEDAIYGIILILLDKDEVE